MLITDLMKNDIYNAFREVGCGVVYNGLTTYGILANEPTEVIELGGKHTAIQSTTLTLMILTNSIGVIKNNTNIEVGGVIYKITKPLPLDAHQTKLWLTAV